MADRIIFVCTVILAVVYLYAAAQIPSLEMGDPMGPRAFPYLLGIFLFIAAGLILKENLKRKEGQDKDQRETVAKEKQDLHHLLVIGAVMVWTMMYFAFFNTLGYLIATAIYLFALMVYFNQGKWIVNGLTSVLFSSGTYLLFNKILGVSIPKGLLKLFHL